MPHFSRCQREALSRVLQLAGSGLPPEALAHQVLRALLWGLPADQAVIFGIDPGSLLINRLLAMVGDEPNGTLFWIRHIYLAREPVAQLTFPSLMTANVRVIGLRDRLEDCWGVPTGALSHMTPHEYHNAYHEAGTPAGGGLRTWFDADGRKIAALQMTRSAGAFGFSDYQFLQRLIPTIGQALASALRREEGLSNRGGDPSATGVLVLSSDGRITMQSPACEKWLEVLAGGDRARPGTSGIAGIPIVVWSAIAGLRATVSSGAIHAALRVPTHSGVLRVEASPAGDDGAIAVTFVPERPPVPPELPASWLLTHQERKVLSLVAGGMTNRQIAQVLVVSDNTVETHLRHAYEKLGVNSRTQYLARLFQEVYWPVQAPQEGG